MPRGIEHPEITRALATGYPSWIKEDYGEDDLMEDPGVYEDMLYDERKEAELFGED